MEYTGPLGDCVLPGINVTFPVAHSLALAMCNEAHEYKAVLQHVCDRFDMIWRMLLAKETDKAHSEAVRAVFSRFIARFNDFWSFIGTFPSKRLVDRLVENRVTMRKIIQFHQELDALLVELNPQLSVEQMDQWREKNESDWKEQQVTMKTQLGNARAISNLFAGGEIVELLTILKFEFVYHYDDAASTQMAMLEDTIDRLELASRITTKEPPRWFIPSYEVQYHRSDPLPEGTFGHVYRGTYFNGTHAIIKRMMDDSDAGRTRFLTEATIWKQLDHPHLIRLYGICHVSKPIFFVCEDATRGNFADYFRVESNRRSMWRLFFEASIGILFLHGRRTVHGNLKCRNLLIGSDERARVSDFGFAFHRSASIALTKKAQAEGVRWKSPEYLRKDQEIPSYKSDVCSFGLCIIESFTNEAPWSSANNDDIINAAFEFRAPDRPEGMDDSIWSLVEKMVSSNPDERPSMAEVSDQLMRFAYMEAQSNVCIQCHSPLYEEDQFCGMCGYATKVDQSVPGYNDFDVANEGQGAVKTDTVREIEEDSHVVGSNFASGVKWGDDSEQTIEDHKLMLATEKNLSVLSELCGVNQENQSLCLLILDRVNIIHATLKHIDSSSGRFDDKHVVLETSSLVKEFCVFVKALLEKQDETLEKLMTQRKVFDEMKMIHAMIDDIFGRLNIDETHAWKEQWGLHQMDLAKRFQSHVVADEKLLENISNWSESLKQLEDEMDLCHGQTHLPAMLFVREAILDKLSDVYAVDVYLLNATDLVFVGQQKKTSDSFVVFQVGDETQYSKPIEGELHHVWDADQRFRFPANTKRGDNLSIQVWTYGRDSSHDAWPVLIGSVTIPIPPLSPRNVDSSTPLAYPLQIPKQFEKQNRRSMIYLKFCPVGSEEASNALAPSGARKGCIICESPVVPGTIYCAACIRAFGQKMLTETLPIWFIPRQRIVFNSVEQATHRGMIAQVFAGALEHDSSVDVWNISPSKDYDIKHLTHQIDLWFMLNHPHVLRLFGACHIEQPVLCVCEHAAYENIAVFLSKDANKRYVWMVLYQAALGLHYLHSQRIVHGDVRCENIVVGIDGKIKLCNFGFSYRRQGSSLRYARAQRKKIRWMAPERINGDDLGESLLESDIYEFGMTIVEAITGNNA